MTYILFIDGENFLHKIEEVLKRKNIASKRADLALINLTKLFQEPLKGLKIKRKLFYASKIRYNKETKNKSIELISFQRKLRNNLVRCGFEFILAGNVRSQKIGKKTLFREKGVDVKIAVDLVALSCDKKLDGAILCSSDSDLQPAISELKNRKIDVVYLGFESNPNKGLIYTSNKTILIPDKAVISLVKR